MVVECHFKGTRDVNGGLILTLPRNYEMRYQILELGVKKLYPLNELKGDKDTEIVIYSP